jgi:hypothetical protein
MLITKEVETGWCPTNRQHYENLGYIYKWRKRFIVPVEHLPENSHEKVYILCDYCLEEGIEKHIPQTWQTYITKNKNSIILKDCCKKHWYKKCSESNIATYGVDNQFKREEIKELLKETNLERYGVEYYTQTEEYKERHKETCIEKYGYDNVSRVPEFIDKIKNTQIEKYGMLYSQTDEYKEKYKNTNLERFGVEHIFQSEEIKEKIRHTNLIKYGFENPQQNIDIKRKGLETLRKNGRVNTSKQQLYLHKLFDGELNYQDKTTGTYILDIAFPEEKIYVEYNGGGHNMLVKTGEMTEGQFLRREMDRYYYLKRNGWKQVKIDSPKDYLPSDEILINELNNALKWLSINEKYHSHYEINIGNYAQDDKYGHLRFIKDEDLEKEVS